MFLHIGRRRGIGGEGGLMPLRRTLANDNGILSGLMFTTVRRGRLAVCGGIDGGIDRVANDEIETVLEADWRGTPLDGSSGTSSFEIGSKPCSATGDHQADDIDSARWSPSWALLGCCRLSPRRPHRRRRPARRRSSFLSAPLSLSE